MDPVCLVTAFGRGATLARALTEAKFSTTVLDFTEAFGPEFKRGLGPFPVATTEFMPPQREWLGEMRALPRGLTFWLKDGPIELAGEMSSHFAHEVPAVKALVTNQTSSDFDVDWLRRFVNQWASPFHADAWENAPPARFPFDKTLALAPGHREEQIPFVPNSVACRSIEDVQFDRNRLVEIAVGAGQVKAYRADQFVWCLSSRETEILNSQIAPKIFNRGIYRAEWSWLAFDVKCQNGPWLEGLPEHVVVVGDPCLPWTYANVVVLRRLPGDAFRAWVKVPAERAHDATERQRYADDVGALLNQRLHLARWAVDAERFGMCPHSPVFEGARRDWSVPPWKNWDWIAPETLPRLDVSARLEREAACVRRLEQWRRDKLKKQGGPRDHALHAT